MPEHSIDAETRGWAHIGRTLPFRILRLMQHRGIISPADAVFAVEQALSALEAVQMKHPDDQSLQVAREALQAMIDALPRSQTNQQ